MKYIGIGNFNKYNIYLLVAFISELLIDSLFGLNSSNYQKPARIFPFRAKIKSHNLLYNFIHLFSIIFAGIILYIFERVYEKKNSNDEVTIEEYETMKINLLKQKSEYATFHIILIGVLYSLVIILENFINKTGTQLNFWTLEILYVAIISYLIFKNKIDRHKKIAISIMFIITIVDIIENFIPTTKHKNLANKNELTDKNVFEMAIIKYGAYSIPLLYLANEFKHIQRDYCWIKAKYLMDIKSKSPYKIFFVIGSIGIIILIIFFSIFTFVPCKTFNNINIIENNYFYNNTNETLKLCLEYCTLKDYDENTKTLYLFYDSIKLISKEYSNTDRDNMLEIFLLIPLLFLFHSANEISRLMLVRYTDPNNILIYRYFYYFVKRIIEIIINEADEQYMRIDKFILFEIEQLAGVISGLIYIEVLELKFCKFDYELKKNIDKRGVKDTIEGLNFGENENTEAEIELHQIKLLEESQEINPYDK